jgi:general stress protein CsbA
VNGHTRRVIARVSIAVDVAVLIAIAIGVRLVHHGLAETAFIVALPVVSALCGLVYLRSARGQR